MSSTPRQTPTGAAILGLDNVPLELPLAGVGSRSLAAIIDYLFLAALAGLWGTACLVTSGLLDFAASWMWAIFTLGLFFLQWGYFAALEIVMQGQTPGKSFVGLRVVSYQGGRSSAGAIVMRNLIRTVDLAFGLAAMAIDRRSRRLGDMAAGTLVVHQQAPGSGDEVELRRVPASWGAREIRVVESFLRRAARMEPQRAQALAEKILRWIRREEEDFAVETGAAVAVDRMGPTDDRLALLRHILQAEVA